MANVKYDEFLDGTFFANFLLSSIPPGPKGSKLIERMKRAKNNKEPITVELLIMGEKVDLRSYFKRFETSLRAEINDKAAILVKTKLQEVMDRLDNIGTNLRWHVEDELRKQIDWEDDI